MPILEKIPALQSEKTRYSVPFGANGKWGGKKNRNLILQCNGLFSPRNVCWVLTDLPQKEDSEEIKNDGNTSLNKI